MDWGDLANPLWKGRMRIIEKSNQVALHFEDSQNGELLPSCPRTNQLITYEQAIVCPFDLPVLQLLIN
jgi:hypothetical protein